MHEAQQYESITAKILEAAPAAEEVYLLAEKKADFALTGIFGATANKVNQYLVLVLISGSNQCHYKEVNKKLQDQGTLTEVIVPITMKLEHFINWAGEGHPFAVQVLRKAALLHSKPPYHSATVIEMDRHKLAAIRKQFLLSGIRQMDEHLNAGQSDEALIAGYKAFLAANLGIEPQLESSAAWHTYCSMIMPDIPTHPEKLLALLKIIA